jgi:hypothetical protein
MPTTCQGRSATKDTMEILNYEIAKVLRNYCGIERERSPMALADSGEEEIELSVNKHQRKKLPKRSSNIFSFCVSDWRLLLLNSSSKTAPGTHGQITSSTLTSLIRDKGKWCSFYSYIPPRNAALD